MIRRDDAKTRALAASRTLNPRRERVSAPASAPAPFSAPGARVEVRYGMVREAEPGGAEGVAGAGEAGVRAARPCGRHRTRRDDGHFALLSNSRISRPTISVMARVRRENR